MQAKTATQYVVTAPCEPARVAGLSEALAEAGVELAGVVMTRVEDELQVRFVAKPRSGLLRKLEGEGLRVRETQVVVLEGAPTLERLDAAVAALARRGVNVLGSQQHFDGGRASWLLCVDKLQAAVEALDAPAAGGKRPKLESSPA